MKSIASVAGMLGMFFLVLLLAYFCTRYLSGRMSVIQCGSSKVEVLDRVMLGPDRSLLLIRTAGRVLLLGVTAHHIEKLEELDATLFAQEAGKEENALHFSTILRDTVEKGWGITRKNKKDS
ncbi:MAG: flagellar biosynthetic protein FliO [Anaerotruncus sp.]|nr:flagellar biosynthetic protein FliO [Anaerotruncus sp.]